MTTQMKTKTEAMVMGVFRTRAAAEGAFDALIVHGVPDHSINLMMSDKTRASYWSHPDPRSKAATHVGNKAAEGMGVGGAIGTAVGATLGAIAAIGSSLAVPALGLVIAGPIAAAFAGGGAGALTGGALGALIGLGITEKDAAVYDRALKEGGVIIGVAYHDSAEAKKIEKIMKEQQGEQVAISAS